MKIYIETPQLLLRDWKEEDLPEFYRINADERVMEYFPERMSESETLDLYNRIADEFARCGFGLYAVETKEDGKFIGFVGFHNITFDVDFAPGVEIGWRLAPETWGKGYATEAGAACLDYAREVLKTDKIYSFTALPNKRSERVMQKIGMHKAKEFGHPLIDSSHPLYEHVLYETDFDR